MPPPKCFSNKHMFKCNLCEIAFAENAFLLTHLKNKHRHSAVSKALKPQFSCGICPAKFFKNSFLVKHCESHELISDPQYYRWKYTYLHTFIVYELIQVPISLVKPIEYYYVHKY